MSWQYKQTTGELTFDGLLIGKGYAGGDIWPSHIPQAVNNPAMQSIHSVGPLPAGEYTIGPVVNDSSLGPIAMHLIADPANEMFGRSGFWMHADSISHPGEASEGCIVMPHAVRLLVSLCSDRHLTVVT